MNQRSLYKLLLQPSFTSGLLVLLAALGILGYTTWSFLNDNQASYDTLFGTYGLQGYISERSSGVMTLQNTLLASPVAYYVLVGGVAIAAGMAVFTLLQIAGLLFRSTTLFMHDAIQGRSARVTFWGEQFVRLGIRVLALVGGAVYAAAFMSMILPFSILLNQTGVEGLNQKNPVGAVMCVSALLLLLIALHLLLVFARVIALRPRLFGGDQEIAAAEVHQ
jgi:hypothetical protein